MVTRHNQPIEYCMQSYSQATFIIEPGQDFICVPPLPEGNFLRKEDPRVENKAPKNPNVVCLHLRLMKQSIYPLNLNNIYTCGLLAPVFASKTSPVPFVWLPHLSESHNCVYAQHWHRGKQYITRLWQWHCDSDIVTVTLIQLACDSLQHWHRGQH